MSFTEQTRAEAGFSTHWDRFITPGLAYHKRHYRLYYALEIIVALVACVVAMGGGYGILLWGVNSDNLWLSVGIAGVLTLVSYGVVHLAGGPHRRLTSLASRQLQNAVAAHFAGWIRPTDDAAAMRRYARHLQKQRMTTSGKITIGTAYDSIASEPAFRFYNCTYATPRTQQSRGRVTTYLIVHIRMARPIATPVKILVDRGMANVMTKIMARRNNIPFDNAAFEKRYEVFAEDENLAREIITPNFQQAMIDLHAYFSADMSWFSDASEISCMLEGDEMVVCLSEIADVDGSEMAKGSAAAIEEAAHHAIAEIGQIPYIVKSMTMAAPALFKT